MNQVIIANLPISEVIAPENFIIIEKPGIGEGTYKSTVGDLQRAITVSGHVEQEGNVVKFIVTDINGTTEATINTPQAEIVDNGDGTMSFIVTDATGTTRVDFIRDTRMVDPRPIPGSNNILTSGTIYNVETSLLSRIDELEAMIGQLNTKIAQLEQVAQIALTT